MALESNKNLNPAVIDPAKGCIFHLQKIEETNSVNSAK